MLKVVNRGDEWEDFEYKQVTFFHTTCGNAGCYLNRSYIARSIEDGMRYIDKSRNEPLKTEAEYSQYINQAWVNYNERNK